MLRPEMIETPRLRLEPVSAEVAQAVVGGDLSVLNAGEGWPHPGTYRGFQAALSSGRPPGWLVVLDGRVIGDCGVHGEPDESGTVEFGLGLAPQYRGLGYGTEVLRGLSAWLLLRADVVAVIGHADSANLASRRVMEKAGFVEDLDSGERVRYILTDPGP